MTSPASISSRIIEGLYCEALVLTDEVRSAFAPSAAANRSDQDDDATVALSCEALRTTTRMMQAVAWLLNHRAFLAGELSEFQLRRYGQLHPCAPADPARLPLLPPEMRELIAETERFHARLMRLDAGWRSPAADQAVDLPNPPQRLHGRARG